MDVVLGLLSLASVLVGLGERVCESDVSPGAASTDAFFDGGTTRYSLPQPECHSR